MGSDGRTERKVPDGEPGPDVDLAPAARPGDDQSPHLSVARDEDVGERAGDGAVLEHRLAGGSVNGRPSAR